ncbi:hypothetical protein CC78DRAFT_570438 [Lojkania enalia]|uniref:Uncharacterized protein n=1 Tax=Lojkania enalia TaxID=147567 RepID=A0A9P4N785_9PLEO|nr:hypothetical protein CC78DRAFT_570438 [Didymosphaeria enalia]
MPFELSFQSATATLAAISLPIIVFVMHILQTSEAERSAKKSTKPDLPQRTSEAATRVAKCLALALHLSTAVTILNCFETEGLFAIRSGGYSPVVRSASIEDDVLVDMSLLSNVTVSENRIIITICAGNRRGKAFEILGVKHLAVTSGRNTAVGVSGLVPGGGISFSQRFGKTFRPFLMRTLRGSCYEMNALNLPDKRQVFGTTTIKNDSANLSAVHAAYRDSIAVIKRANIKGGTNPPGLHDAMNELLALISLIVDQAESRDDELEEKITREAVGQIDIFAQEHGIGHQYRY